nr:hypothetical protein OG461_03575 [Streptomyces sp. NBC_00995]
MNRLNARTERRRSTRASLVFGWVVVLIALASCCRPTPGASDVAHDGPASAFTPGITLAVHVPAARAVVADAPRDRGAGTSCLGASEHSAAVVVPGRPAPAALPTAAAPVTPAPLTGAAAVRGPANDAADEVNRLILQVQRI